MLTIVGGGLAGLCAAIAAAEKGSRVRLLEGRAQLGGRAGSTDGEYVANLGPHALYIDGGFWTWLQQRDLAPAVVRPPLTGARWHLDGRVQRRPPVRSLARGLRARGATAPVDRSFRDWMTHRTNAVTAKRFSAAAGVFTFCADPGALAADFVWPRIRRALLRVPTAARYVVGGWSRLIDQLAYRAHHLGVDIQTASRVTTLPDPPVVVATDLPAAQRLLPNSPQSWPSGHTLCLDLGLVHHPGDPLLVHDLDTAGWIERFTAADPTLAPAGHELLQAQMPVRPGEDTAAATARLETLLDRSVPSWRARVTWTRRLTMKEQTGALDPPGTHWTHRPAIDQGQGVYLAGDMVAAPGLLCEVAHNSALYAVEQATAARPHA